MPDSPANAVYLTAIKQAPSPIMIMAEDGEVVHVNDVWLKITGYSREELRTIEDWTRHAYGDAHVEVAATIRSLFTIDRIVSGGETIIATRHQGKRIWSFSSGPLGVDSRGRKLVISMAIDVTEKKALERRLEHLATHDQLTGLPNRIRTVERLREELQRAARYSSPVSVFLIDIDNFKKINDTLGHRAGDQVLQYFAGILRDSIRSTDHAGRYGGEEFLVILPETDIDEAAELAERLRHRVELNDCLPDGETRLPGPVTVSLGIASFPRHALDVERLIDTADVAMYLAKSGGRNSVVTASTAAGPPPAAPPTH